MEYSDNPCIHGTEAMTTWWEPDTGEKTCKLHAEGAQARIQTKDVVTERLQG